MEAEDDVTKLPNAAVEKALEEIAIKYLKTNNYKKNVERGSSKGDNYIGVIYRVQLEAENLENNCPNKLSVIIKVPPQNEARRQQFFARPTFLREALAYTEILPMLLDFQRSKGITTTQDGGFFHVPKCFTTLTDDGYEAIFLEDLAQKNFSMFNRLENIDINHVKMVMKILGKYHALSFAMKDQVPEKFAKYKFLQDIFYGRRDDENLQQYFDSLVKRAIDTLSPEKDQLLIDRVKQYFAEEPYMQKMMNLISGERAEPYAVLCHGDCWNNNVLYKYKDNKPVDACLIDWQILRYASPACDLTYFLFSITTKEFRNKYFHELMDYYHTELSNLLRKLGSDPDKVFPRKALDQQLKEFGSFGFLMAVMLLPIITSHADDVPDLDELAEKIKDGTLDPNENFSSQRTMSVYVDRIKGVIIDMVDLGYM